ncbi:hypothetical protein [Campylobacter vulpis]|uniref:hypothetical protein n=1 Tax=Campylobacter vulpis TaxID=1655500 RepID=UPI001BD10BAA|nr:hypothetical protein [Campylobacter vulpis]MBS4330231.1 hypothetical protein [Campylobacter vulpis]
MQYLNKNPKDVYLFYVCHMIEFNFGLKSFMLETLNVMKVNFADKFYSYYEGIKAFILNENCICNQSFSSAKYTLKNNRKNIYAFHALCHYYDAKKLMQNMYVIYG